MSMQQLQDLLDQGKRVVFLGNIIFMVNGKAQTMGCINSELILAHAVAD